MDRSGACSHSFAPGSGAGTHPHHHTWPILVWVNMEPCDIILVEVDTPIAQVCFIHVQTIVCKVCVVVVGCVCKVEVDEVDEVG